MPSVSFSRERWRVLEPLLDAALDLDEDKRAAYLDAACGSDRSLREEMNALLEACAREDSLLSMPAPEAYSALLAEPTIELPGLIADRYLIMREIGRGGMATVFLADDRKHGRQVAMKVLHPVVARVIGRERFLREIEIAAGLSHPHILPLHDSGEVHTPNGAEPSLLYFVSPYVVGESLRERLLRARRVPVEEAVQLAREIALALDYAHRHDVVHLDIKPGNILLQDGHAVVADFGIARAMSRADDRPDAGSTPRLGTPSYMSPEQSLNLPDLDGRSDQYSLGCVLYEMITGERPFARAPSPSGIQPMQLQDSFDPEVLSRLVSPELVLVIRRAMAPAREDRYATAGDFAHALSHAALFTTEVAQALSDAAMRSLKTRWIGTRTKLGAGVVLLVAVILAAVLTLRTGDAFDANLIAVAPFDAETPTLVLWKEGMVDVVSRNLDGAGPLRAVPATTIVRSWQGRGHADAQSARDLGRATGARLVLFGGLLMAGDSVRASAVLLDARTGQTLAEFDRRDTPERIDRLSDSLTVAVLRELGRSRRIDLARATSSPTTSFVALKAYLQGEQFYRAALWDSAQARFEQALSLDSAFALAYHRLAAVRQWREPNDLPDSTTYALMRRTSFHAKGLAPREQLLATVDSLSAEAHFAWRRALEDGDYTGEVRFVTTMLATLQDGLRRYPNDSELWFLLAQARTRYDQDIIEGEVDERAILALYDRAIALDSSFAPGYVAPISMALYLDGPASAQRYIHAYLALARMAPHAQVIRLAELLLDPARVARLDVEQLVDTMAIEGLCETSSLLRHLPDTSAVVERFATALANRASAQLQGTSKPECALTNAIDGLQYHGHLREARRVAQLQAHGLTSTVMYNMTHVGMLPADSARPMFKRILNMVAQTQLTKLYRFWATDGDTTAIQIYVRRFQQIAARPHTASGTALLRSNITAGRAFLALAKRDTASALRQFMASGDTLNECWYDSRMTIVELLYAVGRYREAAAHLERRWPGTSECGNGFDDMLWTMMRARVFDRLGRHEQAYADYALVADVWRTADVELQPWVQEARVALTRLKSVSALRNKQRVD